MKAVHVLCFSAILLLFAGCTKSNDLPNEEWVRVGDPLPVFSADGPDGTVYRSADAAGRVTVICLFNTTCPDCHREMPKLEYVWEQLGGREDFEIACVGRQRTLSEITTFWDERNFTMPYYEDPQKTVYNLFATMTIPRIYLADRQGVVREMWVKNTHLTQEQLLSVVKGYLETP